MNPMAAATGASTRELMARMGHASAEAALRYQYATRERNAAIAVRLEDMAANVNEPAERQAPNNDLAPSIVRRT
jgi:hypothetical protein